MLEISYCGDGVIGTGIGYTGGTEICDNGAANSSTGTCSLTCQTQGYDLALITVLSGMQTSFVSGELVTFTITVTNQGMLNANNVIITDYIPAGLTLVDPLRTNANPSQYTIPLSIAAG